MNKRKPKFVSATTSATALLPFQNMNNEEENRNLLVKDVNELNEIDNSVSLMKGKKVKYQLVEYNSLPNYLKDNEYILKYYRCEWPLKQVLFSIFTIHNETLNIWTHLIGFFLFLSLTIYTVIKIPEVPALVHLQEMLKKADLPNLRSQLLNCLPSLPQMPDLHKLREQLTSSLPSMDLLPSLSNWHILQLLCNCLPKSFLYKDACILHNVVEDAALMVGPVTRWPFFVFMSGAMFCLLASSACHLLSCHSHRLSYIMLRLDYAGIAALISTSFYPPVYYSFICYPFYSYLYMGVITVLGIASIMVSLLPVFQSPEYRSLRASLFFGMGVSGAIPIFHKLILYWPQPEAIYTTMYEILMGVLYGIGALIYALRYPEKWSPGKFDIAGSSHQIFHVLVVAGAFTHYHAGLIYLRWRDTYGC